VVAVASDTVGVEALSPNPRIRTPPGAASRSWGMPLGELWVPEALARSCPRDGQYAFLLVSVPLNLWAGSASWPGGRDQIDLNR